jgi:hypothetical protein
MKNILLTFDYELFLHQSGSLDNCIIKPVNRLIKIFDKLEIKAVFFVDILYIQKLKEENLVDQTNKIISNIQKLVTKGHQVELHLHPHWLDAKYNKESKEWDLRDNTHYRLQSFEQQKIEDIFKLGHSLLSSICQEIDPEYRITSFRAGGLCIQPFDALLPLFKKFNITVDSSVAYGFKSDSKTHFYNFMSAPKKELYKFESDPLIINEKGAFFELPIFYYKKNIIDKLKEKLQKAPLISDSKFGDGKAVPPSLNKRPNFLYKFKSDKYMYSLDGSFNEELLIKKILQNRFEFTTIIAHPKLLSEKSLVLIKKLKDKQFQFKTINDIVKK